MDRSIEKELENNKNDKIAIEAQLQAYKVSFAKEIAGDEGKEMKQMISFSRQPVKIKKPFRVRFSEWVDNFKNKLRIVLGE